MFDGVNAGQLSSSNLLSPLLFCLGVLRRGISQSPLMQNTDIDGLSIEPHQWELNLAFSKERKKSNARRLCCVARRESCVAMIF